ncbi:hypothetical protein PT277_05010 [Acetobacteraceae bacterium ESL0709]|nr:hypothetical protein [Acetobacteraceae bacterium ESL0697]MDF7678054.1 hypothetical protein [Acetobacteraceae bacterium ESL0709]
MNLFHLLLLSLLALCIYWQVSRPFPSPSPHRIDLMAEDTLNTTTPFQATGETIAAGLVSLIQTAAGTHTSPTFSHILSITGEGLGIVADELETSLREKLDVNALNNSLQTVINGSQQVELGLQNVRNVLNQRKTDETSPAHTA